MSFLHEIQAPAPVPPDYLLRGAISALAYSEVDSAFNRFPSFIHPEPFKYDEATIYEGQQLMLLGPRSEEVMLSRPRPEEYDPGIRTVEVAPHDETERLYLLGCRGDSLVMTQPLPDGAEELIGVCPIVPQIHRRDAIESARALPEHERTVRKIRTLRHARALGVLISQGTPVTHPDA
jgi:hypothetical protein